MGVTGDGRKVQCCKEQYCIGTWTVRSMNQSKLEVLRQEMAKVNINSLGTGELNLTGMGEFNSNDHWIYYCGQESLRRNGLAFIVNKRVQNAVLVCNLKAFIVVSESEIDVFLELPCLFYEPMDVGNLVSGFSAFSKSSLYIWNFSVHIMLEPYLRKIEHYLASM